MKIAQISLSVFELPAASRRFHLEDAGHTSALAFVRRNEAPRREEIHVLHVLTDEGVEGICTVGDVRYARMTMDDLEQLRLLAIGEDALARGRVDAKLAAATRHLFTVPGWAGAFDNCLWDIAGKVAGLPVFKLLGAPRNEVPAYYNFFGASIEEALNDAQAASAQGFFALKDHFGGSARANRAWFAATRAQFPEAVLMHDAALCTYSFEDAVAVGDCLKAEGYLWFEEPLPDRHLSKLIELCRRLDIPIAGCETMMGDHALCAEWLRSGAVDILRGNGRHGTTSLVKLAAMAECYGTTLELNGPGGLFGLVNLHLCCGLAATTYYEFFAGGTRDTLGKQIGLANPPLPSGGYMRPPEGPGWGAQWDRPYFEKIRKAYV